MRVEAEDGRSTRPCRVPGLIRRLSGSASFVALTASIAAHALVGALFLTRGPAIVDMGAPIVVEIIVAGEEPLAIPSPDPSTVYQPESATGQITTAGDESELPRMMSGDVEGDEAGAVVATVTNPRPTAASSPGLSSVVPPEPAGLEEPAIVVRDVPTIFAVTPVKPSPSIQNRSENDVGFADEARTLKADDAPEQAEISDEATEEHSPIGPQNTGSQENPPEHASSRSAEAAAITLPGDAPTLGEARAAPALGNPKPRYPQRALARGIQGRVILSVEVAASGVVGKVGVAETSGHRMLDVAAVRAVSQWRFRPARRVGVPVEDHVTIPIVFRLME